VGKIAITAILKAKPGYENQLFDSLKQVVQPSQNESGCIHYQLHESIDDQGVFVFYEIWQDEESLKKHVESDHYKAYRQQAEKLIDSRNVYRLKLA
jgi:quinol monooxygenase YgiN